MIVVHPGDGRMVHLQPEMVTGDASGLSHFQPLAASFSLPTDPASAPGKATSGEVSFSIADRLAQVHLMLHPGSCRNL